MFIYVWIWMFIYIVTPFNSTGWWRPIGWLKLQVILCKRAPKYRSLLRKMTYKDKGSYESSPPCNASPLLRTICVGRYVCTYVCMCVCIYKCTYAYLCVYMCLYVCLIVNIHMNIDMNVFSYAGMYVCTYLYVHVCTYENIHMLENPKSSILKLSY